MKPSRFALIATIVCNLGLIAGLWVWCGWFFGLLLSLPLLAPLPGLIRGRTYTAAWASLMLIFYVAGVLSEGLAVRSRHAMGLGLSILAALEFLSLLLFVRWTARERTMALAQAAPPQTAPGQTADSGAAPH